VAYARQTDAIEHIRTFLDESGKKTNMLIGVRICESQFAVHALGVCYEVSDMILQRLGALKLPLAQVAECLWMFCCAVLHGSLSQGINDNATHPP
jgi:hypothetical protein